MNCKDLHLIVFIQMSINRVRIDSINSITVQVCDQYSVVFDVNQLDSGQSIEFGAID